MASQGIIALFSYSTKSQNGRGAFENPEPPKRGMIAGLGRWDLYFGVIVMVRLTFSWCG